MKQSLHFLYTRIKKSNITKEQAESKVCQEILISKIAADTFLKKKVAFKGGIIIDAIANQKRGYTKDIDFDLIKYPLSKDSLSSFFERMNNKNPFDNIVIKIESVDELRHKNYRGQRLLLSFSDSIDEYKLTIDVGVYYPLIKQNIKYDYNIAFGGTAKLSINPVERILADKLSTIAIYGTDNTREKDIFDIYFFIKNIQLNRNTVMKMLIKLLVIKLHFYNNWNSIKNSIINTLCDKEYINDLNKSSKNWCKEKTDVIIRTIIDFIKGF